MKSSKNIRSVYIDQGGVSISFNDDPVNSYGVSKIYRLQKDQLAKLLALVEITFSTKKSIKYDHLIINS